MNGVSPSEVSRAGIPAFRNSTVADVNTPGGLANNSSVSFDEPAYLTAGAVNAIVTYKIMFPLRLIKNTAFSIDKNLYFGQTTYFKVYFGPLSKTCYVSDSAVSPSIGTKTAYAGAATITNLQLMLAVETNQDLRTKIINEVSTSGLSYLIPYVQAFKNSNQGTSQNISIQLDQGNGRSLMKVYHAPYNNTENFDLAYDHANTITVSGADAVANQKVYQYYTQLNGKRNQDITIDCTTAGPFFDYMQHRRQLRGSILRNLNIYQYNWFHCDDWTDFGPRYDQDNKGELISGIPMSVAPLTWSFVGVSMRASPFQHYTWFVFLKKLTMAPGQVIVQ